MNDADEKRGCKVAQEFVSRACFEDYQRHVDRRFKAYQKEVGQRFQDYQRRTDQRFGEVSKLPEVVIEQLKRDRQYMVLKVFSYITTVAICGFVIVLMFVV